MQKLTIALVSLFSFAASASEVEHYKQGFVATIEAPLGFTYYSESSLQVSGVSLGLDVSLGGAVTRNIVISGHIWGSYLTNPTVWSNGRSVTLDNSSVTAGAVGPQFTYYFVPSNWSLSGTVGVGLVSANFDGKTVNSDGGLAAQFGVAKQWYVGDRTSLGVSMHLNLSSNGDADATLSGTGVDAAFIVSF